MNKLIVNCLFALLPFCFISCIDPVSPEFEFFDGQVNVEAYASTVPESSYVIITKSNTDFGLYRTLFEKGAKVFFVNATTNVSVELEERDEDYVPPVDFVVGISETWELNILLEDGKEIKSEPETVVAPVRISNLSSSYDAELKFRESTGRYIPGHNVNINFEDPADIENYYYWRFKSYEKLDICQFCASGIFRNDICSSDGTPHMYSCDTDCWRIRYNERIAIFSDEFTNGTTISNLPVAEVLLYTKQNILVTVEQLALTPKAYSYYKTLKDLVDNNSSLNAPPPAALLGNLYNASDNEEYITGRFTAAATSTYAIFIDRSGIVEESLETQPNAPFEEALDGVVTAPCKEGRFRTGTRPVEWQD